MLVTEYDVGPGAYGVAVAADGAVWTSLTGRGGPDGSVWVALETGSLAHLIP
jgi:hypothetical protein